MERSVAPEQRELQGSGGHRRTLRPIAKRRQTTRWALRINPDCGQLFSAILPAWSCLKW